MRHKNVSGLGGTAIYFKKSLFPFYHGLWNNCNLVKVKKKLYIFKHNKGSEWSE